MAYADEIICTTTVTNIVLGNGNPVFCEPPPIQCTLEITGVAKTDETTLGAADGSITITISGATGATQTYTVYKEDIPTTNTTGVFTGLTSGQYNVRVDEGVCFDTWADEINILQGYFQTQDFITNTSRMPELSASENPIIFQIQTPNTGQQPQHGIYTFTVTGTIEQNRKIVFDLETPLYKTTIISRGFPNRSNYMLSSVLTDAQGTELTQNSSNDIAISLAECIESDLMLSKLYYVSVDDNVITLKTKERTNKYNLVLNENIFLYNESGVLSNTGIAFASTQQGQDQYQGSVADGYSVYAQIYTSTTEEYGSTPNLNNFFPVAELNLPYLSNNRMRFDLSEVLKPYCSTPKIDFTFSGWTTMPTCIRPYYIVYGEKFYLIKNSSSKKKREKGDTRDDIKYYINSSLPWETPNNMADYLGENLHNVRPDFVLDISGSQYNYSITISDYLFDTGSTKTTNIMFNLQEDGQSAEGWQTGTTFTGIGVAPYPTGTFWVSGNTSGTTFTYSASWYKNPYAEGYINNNTVIERTGVKFLTPEPNPKLIERNSTEYLYFILPKDYGKPLDFRGDIKFYDGTSILNYKFFDVVTDVNNFGGVIAVACGADKLNLAAIEMSGGTLRKIRQIDFAIYQESGTTLFSEIRSFKFRSEDAERKFGIMFLNSLGGFDAWTFNGLVERSVKRTYGTYTLPKQYNLDGSSPRGFSVNTTYDVKTVKTVTCNSGWINSAHMDYLVELLKSNVIVSYTEENQNYLNLVNYSYIKSSLEDEFDMECTFEFTTFENNISL